MKALHDMETLGLIQRKKQGQGKPTRIFLKNIIEEKVELSHHDETKSTAPAGNMDAIDEIHDRVSESAENDCGQAGSVIVSSVVVSEEPDIAQDEKWDTPTPVSDSVPNEEPFIQDCEAKSLTDCVNNVLAFGDECAQNYTPAFGDECAQNRPNEGVQTAYIGTSRGLKTGSQDFPNQDPNYNKRNKNKKNNTDSTNINLSPPTPSLRRVTLPPTTREEMEEDKEQS